MAFHSLPLLSPWASWTHFLPAKNSLDQLRRIPQSPPMYGVFITEMRKRTSFPPAVIIPGAGHAMNRQNPKAFNEAVLQFRSEH
jgi:pimeloyl-ACP methyl ester carboxylesterase